MDGGGEAGDVDEAHVEGGADGPFADGLHEAEEDGEEDEGEEGDDGLESPVEEAVDDGLAGEFDAVEEEEEDDGGVGEPVKDVGADAVAGQQEAEDDADDDAVREAVCLGEDAQEALFHDSRGGNS